LTQEKYCFSKMSNTEISKNTMYKDNTINIRRKQLGKLNEKREGNTHQKEKKINTRTMKSGDCMYI
jgi:hypothetical protein